MADTTFGTVLPALKAVDLGDGTYAIAARLLSGAGIPIPGSGALGASAWVIASDAPAEIKAYATILQAAGYPVWVCDGTADDVQIQAAITATGEINLSQGHFSCTSSITISTARRFKGAGCRDTQIVQTTADTPLFTITGAQGSHISDFSVSTVAGTGDCFLLNNVHRATFEDIESPGCGRYVFYLRGCLLNTFKRVSASTNIPGLFAGVSGFTAGFYGDVYTAIACNANSFVGCVIEGGDYGWYFANQAGEGNNAFFGGVAEGQSTYGLYAINAEGLKVYGTHFEGAGSGIYLSGCDCSHINPGLGSQLTLVDCKNVEVSGEWSYGIEIDNDCQYTKLDNLIYGAISGNIVNYSDSTIFGTMMCSASAVTHCGREFLLGRDVYLNPHIDWDGGAVPINLINYNTATITKTGAGEADTTAKLGTYAALVSKAASANSYKGLETEVVPLSPSEWVVVEAYIKVVDGTPTITAWIDGGAHISNIGLGIGTTDWQLVVASFQLPADHTSMRVMVHPGYATAAGSFYLGGLRVLVDKDKEQGELPLGKHKVISSKLDLSGAASDVEVYHAASQARLYSYKIVYTEASSADAGVSIRVGKYSSGVALDNDYFDITTSEVSKDKGYSLAITSPDLTLAVIAAGATVTVGTAGSKVGTGEVMLILDIIEY